MCFLILKSYELRAKIYFFLFPKRRPRWHSFCLKISCQPLDYFNEFLKIIPRELDPDLSVSPKDFSGNRQLPLAKTVVLTLSLVSSGSNQGVDIKNGKFFRDARRSGLWPDARAVHRSAVTKARSKIPWRQFEKLACESAGLARELFPENDEVYLWHGMSVFAFDGSKYNLPATDEIRAEFDPDSGLGNPGKGHCPQCLVSTAYDVFRRLPVARTAVPLAGSEREELKKPMPWIPEKSVSLFDRGYPSFDVFDWLGANHSGYWLFRCPATRTFPAVEKFVESGKQETVAYIKPSNKAKQKVEISRRHSLKAVKARIVRLVSPDGEVSVLLTNLFNKNKYPADEIVGLYFKRWRVEEYYRDEKVTFEIERFHSRTVNGVLQELYAAMAASLIARCLMALSNRFLLPENRECQFKNAAMAAAAEAFVLVPDEPGRALEIFKELLREIAQVKYYRPLELRSSQPRVNKRPVNKWQDKKIQRLAA